MNSIIEPNTPSPINHLPEEYASPISVVEKAPTPPSLRPATTSIGREGCRAACLPMITGDFDCPALKRIGVSGDAAKCSIPDTCGNADGCLN